MVQAVRVRRLPLLEGARRAEGATVVIDVFRAFTTAAFTLAAGVERLVLAEELDEARRLAGRLGARTIGEEEGHRPEDFDFGNSPAEVLRAELRGETVVQRSSAGTRAVRAALANGAGPVLAASLVVAKATAAVLAEEEEVLLVPAGRFGREQAAEDEACADYLEALLGRAETDRPALVEQAFDAEGGRRLRDPATVWADPADLGLCLALDLFDFAMRAEQQDVLVVLQPCTAGFV